MRIDSLNLWPVLAVVLASSLIVGGLADAGSESMKATKREIYQDDSTESMREAMERRDIEAKEHEQRMLSNSDESVQLLKEIRDLLKQLNEKE